MTTLTHTHDISRRSAPLAEHMRVRLPKALPEHHLHAGDAGTIVHLYRRGGLEVEFGAESGSSRVVALDSDSVEPLAD